METPNKVKMFVWRLVHNSLAVWRNLARRGMKVDTLCPMCHRFDEDPVHLFFKCKAVKECRRSLNHSHKVPGSTGSRNGVEGRHFIKLWYEGGIPLWNDKLLCGT